MDKRNTVFLHSSLAKHEVKPRDNLQHALLVIGICSARANCWAFDHTTSSKVGNKAPLRFCGAA